MPKGKARGKRFSGGALVDRGPSFEALSGGHDSQKVLVIPTAPILSGMTALPAGLARVTTNLGGTRTAPMRPRSSSDLLQSRRQTLLHFAETVLNQFPLFVSVHRAELLQAGLVAGEAKMSSLREGTGPEARGYTLLEAVGALIVDARDIDRVSLESTGLAKVLDNVLISMVPPLGRKTAPKAPRAFWHQQNINLAAARQKELDGLGVLAGVLDTGIDARHPEFAGKTIHFAEFDKNGTTISTSSRDAGDHGTHVCGLIAGRRAGIAPKAGLAVAAVLTIPTGRGLSGYLVQIAAGLNWLLNHSFRGPEGDLGVDLLNASLGGSGYHTYLYQLLANARQSPGTGLVAAIGNSGQFGMNNHGSPGNYDIVLGVGAIDAQDQVASFSDWGQVAEHGGIPKPDLSAPGVDVISSIPGRRYLAMSGTSMAAPIVTGAAALLLQQDPSLSFNVPGLFSRLGGLVRPLQGLNRVRGGAGTLDMTAI